MVIRVGTRPVTTTRTLRGRGGGASRRRRSRVTGLFQERVLLVRVAELPAGGLGLVAPLLADARLDPVPPESLFEPLDAIAARPLVRRLFDDIERYQIDVALLKRRRGVAACQRAGEPPVRVGERAAALTCIARCRRSSRANSFACSTSSLTSLSRTYSKETRRPVSWK